MSVTEYLFVTLSAVIALLGVVLVFHALWIFRQERMGKLPPGPQMSLKLFKMEVTGSRPLAIFAVGASLVVFPLGFSQMVITEASKPIYPLPIVPPAREGEYIKLKEPPNVDYEGVRFLKDIKVIDLRSRIPVHPHKQRQKYSPVPLIRYTLLEKLSTDVEEVPFVFGTSGVGLDPRCLTHRFSLIEITDPIDVGELHLEQVWHVMVNVKHEQPHTPFLIVNEATYWNAFRGEDKEWASMAAYEASDMISLVILFPEGKPIKTYALYAIPHESKERMLFRDPSIVFASENRQVFVWKVENPKPDMIYRVDWTW